MADINWPEELPSCLLLDSYSQALPDNVIRDDFPAQPSDVRRRSTATPFPVAGKLVVTSDEWAAIREFFRDTLFDGVLPFGFDGQGTTGLIEWLVRFTSPPTRTALRDDLWEAAIEFEVLSYVPGSPKLRPSAYQDADTFHHPHVSSDQFVRHLIGRYIDADNFYTPLVLKLHDPQTLLPSLYTDTDTVYQPKINRRFYPGLYTDADTFYSPTFFTGNDKFLEAPFITDADTFWTPVTTGGTAMVRPSLYSDGDTFYAPVVDIEEGFANDWSIILNSSASLTRVQTAGTSRKKMTFSYWYYCDGAGHGAVISEGITTQIDAVFMLSGFAPTTVSPAIFLNSGAEGFLVCTDDLVQDDWNHIVVHIDTANATEALRARAWLNGSEVTLSGTPLTLDYETAWGEDGGNEVAAGGTDSGDRVDELCKVENQLLSPSTFATGGAPIDLSGLTFGADGYWLRFETAVGATAGVDSSPNGHDFASDFFTDDDFDTGAG